MLASRVAASGLGRLLSSLAQAKRPRHSATAGMPSEAERELAGRGAGRALVAKCSDRGKYKDGMEEQTHDQHLEFWQAANTGRFADCIELGDV
jgi:hypothetical protein